MTDIYYDANGNKVKTIDANHTEKYTYDAVGNREKEEISYPQEEISNAYAESRTYLYYASSDRLKTDGRFAYVYDNNGNLVQKGNRFAIAGDVVSFTATFGDGVEYWEYDYDLRNRLVAVRKSGLAESDLIEIKYTYDPG
jgi:YD repeat-containing protein